VIAWHRKGFRLFWTWKVRRGQPGFAPTSLVAAIIVPILGYVFFFKVVPWIIEGFRKK
jgi:hypothetical protein